MSELRHQEIIDRVHYMYLQTDGTIEFPNSFEGDLLKIAYGTAVQSIKQPQLNENQYVVLDWLKSDDYPNYSNIFDLFSDLLEYQVPTKVGEAFTEMMTDKKQQIQVLQAFSCWAIEQEEAK